VDIAALPESFPRLQEITTLAVEAAGHVKLSAGIRRITLVFDAPEFEGSAYWHVERDDPPYVEATLYGSPRDILSPPLPGGDPLADVDLDRLGQIDPERVDRLRVDRWLHRNFLQLDDVVCGRVRPHALPTALAAGFQACWDVWTDGRLRQRQQPGLSLAERRRVFFRVFASRGMLLPRHWQVFHELWEGGYGEHEGLLRALSHLPRP